MTDVQHKCHQVDINRPHTWDKYPNDINGANAISFIRSMFTCMENI